MQAQVHLLEWDGRRMSEAARATEDIDTLYYPPPRYYKDCETAAPP